MEAVLKAFIEQDPDGNGQNDTMGLVVHSDVYGDYPNNTFAIDNVFTALGAYSNIWITAEDGSAVYGSVQEEMKQPLELLSRWYQDGIIDKEFATRTNDNIVGLISTGKCGAFIGPWWAPFNQAQTSTYGSDDAEWVNVSAPVGEDGKINAISTKSYAGFVVVRKDFAYPELAMKIVNVNSEYSKQDKTETAAEVKENQTLAYFNWPLYCEVQPGNNAEIMTQHVLDVMDGKADASTLTTEEPANFLVPAFFEPTDSMGSRWASLEKMEMETVLKIITGEQDISTFDTFVEEWKKAGGDTITEEVNEVIAK